MKHRGKALELPEEQRPLGTVAQVATRLQLSRGSVYKLMDAGDLAYLVVCGRRRVRWEDVAALEDAGRVGS